MPRYTTKQLRGIVSAFEDSTTPEQAAAFEQFASRAMLSKYSMRNLILIWTQRPDAVHVAGYTAWKRAGRQVKRGEAGIAIFCPILGKVKLDGGDEVDQVVNVKVGYVFDISQTEPAGAEQPAGALDLVAVGV